MKLSILICTTIDRRDMFVPLFEDLKNQAEGKSVEILYIEDNKEISVGKKRQQLLDMAKGDYVCFHDSDDWHSEDYIDQILEAIENNPDCVGMKIKCEGCQGQTAAASIKYKKWEDNKFGYDYVRYIYHKTPVKRTHAIAVGFEDLRFSEDHKYSMGLLNSGLLKDEVFIDKQIYIYRFKYEEPNKKYGIK